MLLLNRIWENKIKICVSVWRYTYFLTGKAFGVVLCAKNISSHLFCYCTYILELSLNNIFRQIELFITFCYFPKSKSKNVFAHKRRNTACTNLVSCKFEMKCEIYRADITRRPYPFPGRNVNFFNLKVAVLACIEHSLITKIQLCVLFLIEQDSSIL